MSNQRKFEEILGSNANKLCIISGPGSGKTSGVLIPKAQNLIADTEINPNEILILTFSRLSSLDLKRRVQSFDRKPRASTVHSYCLSLLMSEDDHDIRDRINSVLLEFEKEVLLSDLKIIFPQKSKNELKKMLYQFSAGWATKPHEEVFIEDEEKRSFKAAVLNWLSEHEAALMEEVVYNAVKLARSLPDTPLVRDPKYIFIDEFQDLNTLEQEFIKLLATNSELLIVVGDPDQSIYSFKYAHPRGVLDIASHSEVENHTLPYIGRCSTKIIDLANQLLHQANPTRAGELRPLPNAPEGQTNFIRKETQDEEFEYILNDIKERVQEEGKNPKDLLILVPRRKLGVDFATYANGQLTEEERESYHFEFTSKIDFSQTERERLLLFSLIARPESVLHFRSYLGIQDGKHFSKEFAEIKQKYESLQSALRNADPNDFDKRKKRTRSVCIMITELRSVINQYQQEEASVENLLEKLFPSNDPQVAQLRELLHSLLEGDDTVVSLYSKFLDFIKMIPDKENVVRIMTLMGSKGLEADSVYILGCNDGNIPGQNRSEHLSDFEYKQEQRRLLYVGFTRARNSLTISWSRLIPFRQSRGHYTRSVRTITRNGERYSVVGISEFLQDLSGVSWHN